jgi:hypothetical protein
LGWNSGTWGHRRDALQAQYHLHGKSSAQGGLKSRLASQLKKVALDFSYSGFSGE